MTSPTEGRTLAVKLKLNLDDLRGNATKAAQYVRTLGKEFDDLGRKSPKKLNDVAFAAAGIGTGLLGSAGAVVTTSATFERQMSEVKAVAGATSSQMDMLGAAAIRAGKDTVFSATESAQAEAELAKAGLTASDILGGALSGALSLAAAGSMGLADAATIAAQTMNEFQLSGRDVGHIADVLASAANTSAADMHDLGMGLQQVGLVAHATGFTLEETVGILSAFADRGLRGSDGATSLKTALLRLQAPTDEVKALMADLGIKVSDGSGNMIDAAGIAGQLRKALGGLTQEQRNAALATIFGSDAIRAATVLYDLGEDGVKRYTKQVDQSGAAAETARQKTDNLLGDLERLRGTLESMAIGSGGGSLSGLRRLTQWADEFAAGVSRIPAPVQETAVVLAGLTGGALLVSAGMLKARQRVNEAVEALNGMGPAGARAGRGLSTAATWAGRATVALVALQAAGALLQSFRSDVQPNVDALAKSLDKFAESGQQAGEMARLFGRASDDLDPDKITDLDRALASVASKGFPRASDAVTDFVLGLAGIKYLDEGREKIEALDQALAQMVSSGHADKAQAAFAMLEQRAREQGLSMTRLHEAFPSYFAALSDVPNATNPVATSMQTAAEKAGTMARSMNDAVAAGKSLKDMFDQLNGANLDLSDAQIKVAETLDRLNTALKESHGSLDISTEKGRAARSTLNDYARAAADAAQKTYDQSGSLEAANGVWERYIGELRKSLLSAGLTKAQVDALIQSIASMPTYKATQFDLIYTYKVRGTPPRSLSYADIPTGRIGGQRWGGVYEHAQEGALRDARLFSPMGPARYAFAEPATGGEAFVPKYGDYGRSMAIMSHAASWYGAQVVPGGGAGVGGVQRIEVDIMANGERVRRVIIDAAAARGQTVARYIGVTP